ncbi:MAG TPA: D-2-hydroxyacid dehydrogenase [bacterium]|nr:D-2-hydroxyacid dehydrogenase [bacterium]
MNAKVPSGPGGAAAGPGARSRPAVVVLYATNRPAALEPVAEAAEIRYVASADELRSALAGAPVLFVADFRSGMLRDAWPHARDLRWIHHGGAGVDPLLFPELVSSDVVLTNSGGVFDRAMAEYVLGLVLAFAKDFPRTFDLQRRHEWLHRESERIDGKTVLVVGAGSIGREIGRLLHAAGMRVLGVARRARPAAARGSSAGGNDAAFARVAGIDELQAVLPEADYVVLSLPLTNETRGLFGAAAFARMKPTARFINVGRGAVVDEPALVDALRSRRIAGAAPDVFTSEPLPSDHPLWELPGVIVSPHMSGDFQGWAAVISALFVENFKRWHGGRPLLNVVDKERGYVPTR